MGMQQLDRGLQKKNPRTVSKLVYTTKLQKLATELFGRAFNNTMETLLMIANLYTGLGTTQEEKEAQEVTINIEKTLEK